MLNSSEQGRDRGPGWTPQKRLAGKVAVVIGAGQSPGEGLGNGRATTIRFAREGARVLAVDLRIESVEETAALIRVKVLSVSLSRPTLPERSMWPPR